MLGLRSPSETPKDVLTFDWPHEISPKARLCDVHLALPFHPDSLPRTAKRLDIIEAPGRRKRVGSLFGNKTKDLLPEKVPIPRGVRGRP